MNITGEKDFWERLDDINLKLSEWSRVLIERYGDLGRSLIRYLNAYEHEGGKSLATARNSFAESLLGASEAPDYESRLKATEIRLIAEEQISRMTAENRARDINSMEID